MLAHVSPLAALMSWIGTAACLLILAGHLYGKAEYDAWGADNLDMRLFVAGACCGVGVVWFLLAPSLIFTQVSL